MLPPFVAFFCYSEAGAFDPATRSLTGEPLGWTLCPTTRASPTAGTNFSDISRACSATSGDPANTRGDSHARRHRRRSGRRRRGRREGARRARARRAAARSGPAFADPGADWTHFESDATIRRAAISASGRPIARSRRGCASSPRARCSFSSRASAGRRTTTRATRRAPRPACSATTTGADRDRYDSRHLFPFGYRELMPYYEWVEATLPVETAPMG